VLVLVVVFFAVLSSTSRISYAQEPTPEATPEPTPEATPEPTPDVPQATFTELQYLRYEVNQYANMVTGVLVTTALLLGALVIVTFVLVLK
jgi:hypothetical protein